MVQWKKLRITATGLVAGIGAGNTYGGIITQAVGTTTTIAVYDDTSAVTASLITPVTATATTNVAGVFTPCIGSSVGTLVSVPAMTAGVVLDKGLFITVGGTGSPTFLVLYR
jgi:hypothetical protein